MCNDVDKCNGFGWEEFEKLNSYLPSNNFNNKTCNSSTTRIVVIILNLTAEIIKKFIDATLNLSS